MLHTLHFQNRLPEALNPVGGEEEGKEEERKGAAMGKVQRRDGKAKGSGTLVVPKG